LNILHIAPTPFFADRGCHIRIRNEVESLAGRPVRVTICTYHHGRDVGGMRIRRIPPIPGYSKLAAGFSPYRFLADILLFFLVLRVAWQDRPDVLHAHLHEGCLIGWLVRICLFWRKLPLIMDMQGSLSGELVSYGTIRKNGLLHRLVGWFERLLCRLPDFFFTSSVKSRNVLLDQFGVREEKVVLLPDVLPERFFRPGSDRQALRKELAIPVRKRIVMYTGSLLKGKGIEHVLEAMRILCGQDREVFFVLVGYPLDEAASFVSAHGLEDRVLLPGRISYEALHRWLACADVALEPKIGRSGEASGKLLHYMAAGLPVVCFNTLNNRELLGDIGYYAKEISSEAFAAAIAAALGDGEKALARGRQGSMIAAERYSMQAIGSVMLETYRRQMR